MTTNSLRDLIYLHFERCEDGQGQFIYGAWFKPKTSDSLQRLLEDLGLGAPRTIDPDPSFL